MFLATPVKVGDGEIKVTITCVRRTMPLNRDNDQFPLRCVPGPIMLER